jgi:hypothetical protein
MHLLDALNVFKIPAALKLFSCSEINHPGVAHMIGRNMLATITQ